MIVIAVSLWILNKKRLVCVQNAMKLQLLHRMIPLYFRMAFSLLEEKREHDLVKLRIKMLVDGAVSQPEERDDFIETLITLITENEKIRGFVMKKIRK